MEQGKPQAKRARFAASPLQQQTDVAHAAPGPQLGLVQSCTTGAKIASQPAAAPAIQQSVKVLDSPSAALTSSPPTSVPATLSTAKAASGPSAPSDAAAKGPSAPPATKPAAAKFHAKAREAVFFRAVSSPTPEGLHAEIASGGQPVSVEYFHQNFGDAEEIRGFSNLKITIWVHVRTYHTWVDIVYSAKRPGADRLGDIFEGAFPTGYCRSQEELIEAVTTTLASLPDLTTLGACIGKVPIAATAFGVRTPRPAAAAAAGGAGPMELDGAAVAGGGKATANDANGVGGDTVGAISSSSSSQAAEAVEVVVRGFQVKTAPPEIKALHGRLECLLQFTVDGAQFINDEDASWELLLPVARAEDGGCLVLGLTTLMNFYSYPSSCRLRVSQVLVLSPWQGLGLGKALLRLSYGLAKARGCADLTVEDPTPNLQRVREKLEVEMMRQLDWVVAQAAKCVGAAARGATSWPAWSPPPHHLTTTSPPAAAHAPLAPPAPAAVADAPPTPPQQPPQPGSAAAQQQESSGPQPHDRHQPPLHPLLASHGFFAALGAVPPSEGRMALPEAVAREAAEAAEAHWRQRLAEGEAAAAATAAAEAAVGPAEAAAGGAAPSVARGAASSSSGAPASTGAGDVADVFVPSAAFVAAVSRELKMHKGKVRTVWEGVLWSHPGALRRLGVRAALERLIARRLQEQMFSSIGRTAAVKRIVDTDAPKKPNGAVDGTEPGSGSGGTGSGSGSKAGDAAPQRNPGAAASADGDGRPSSFFMYRPVGRPVAAEGQAAAAATAAAEGAVDESAVTAGRLRIKQVTTEDKDRTLAELVSERVEELESLLVALNRPRRLAGGAGGAAASSAH